MDKTILSLVTILITGTGIIGNLKGYNPQELAGSYLGSNPFAIKKRHIDRTVKRSFAFLAFCGLAIQLYPFFFPNLPARSHGNKFYAICFILGILVMLLSGLMIKQLGLALAKRTWLPELREKMKKMYQSSKFIIENDGWRPDQLKIKDQLRNPENYRKANFESADGRIELLEKIFNKKRFSNDRKERISKLSEIFE